MVESQENSPRCIVEDCTLPVDIILISSDNKEYPTHRENLGTFSAGFPTQSMTVNTAQDSESIERANLDERGAVLQLLLPFMHHTHNLPDLTRVKFGDVVDFAEAVKKWQVFSAMPLCELYMQTRARDITYPEYAMAILLYSVKHGYVDMANCAAPNTLSLPMEWVVAKVYKAGLGDDFLVKWIRYRHLMLENVAELLNLQPFTTSHNTPGSDYNCRTQNALVENVNSLLLRDPQETLQFSQFLHATYFSKEAAKCWEQYYGPENPDIIYVRCLECLSKCAEWVKAVEESRNIHEYEFSNLPKIKEI